MKSFLTLLCLGLVLILVNGFSSSENASSYLSDKSQAVLISDGNGNEALSVNALFKNTTNKNSKPFYVEYNISDKWLASQIAKSTLVYGEGFYGDQLQGKKVIIKPHATYQTGETFKIRGNINKNKLKKL